MSAPARCHTALGALTVGARAALRAPRHIQGHLGPLLEPREGAASRGEHVELSLRTARRGVRALALIPGSPWRNTCLFRSVAKCLALREHGVAARLRLGVRGDGRGIDAHAWVEFDGALEPDEEFTPIEPSRAASTPPNQPGPRNARREAGGR